MRNLRLQNINLDTGCVITAEEKRQHNVPELIGEINPIITKAYVTNRGDDSIRAFTIGRTWTDEAAIVDGNSIPVGASPSAVVFDPIGRYAWVANHGERDLSLVDPLKDVEIDLSESFEDSSRLVLDREPEAVAMSPEGYRLFVVTPSHEIAIIDLNRREKIKTIDIEGGAIMDIVASSDGKRVCASVRPNKIVIIDTQLTSLDDLLSASYETEYITIKEADYVNGVAFDPTGQILYVADRSFGTSLTDELYAVDCETKRWTSISTFVTGSRASRTIDVKPYIAPLANISDFIDIVESISLPKGMFIDIDYLDMNSLCALAPLGGGLLGNFIGAAPVTVAVNYTINPVWLYDGGQVAIPALRYDGLGASSLLYESFLYTANMGIMGLKSNEFAALTVNKIGAKGSVPAPHKMAVSTIGYAITTNTSGNSIGFFKGRKIFETFLSKKNEFNKKPLDELSDIGHERRFSEILHEPVGVGIQPVVYQILPVQGEQIIGDLGRGGAEIACLIFSRINIKDTDKLIC